MASSAMDMEQKLVFFDLETAGLNPDKHPILQIGAIAVNKNLEAIEEFEVKIRFDESKANKNSLRKNHYHRGIWVRDGVDPEEAAHRFSAFLRRHATIPMVGSDGMTFHVAQLVAHNAAFDGEFLQAWFRKRFMFLPARYQVLCTLQRATWHFQEHPTETPPADFKLATLCKHFGVPFHAASAHEALADVRATVALYRALVGRAARFRHSTQSPAELNQLSTHPAAVSLNGASS
jgi:DNA polymerase III epsilon subunit-like protein